MTRSLKGDFVRRDDATTSMKLREAMEILRALGLKPKQCNELAGYVLLALLDLKPDGTWRDATNPLMGITPIIDFVSQQYGQRYAPNTRETVRDEAAKYFCAFGMLVRNPDDPIRPTTSPKTVYQVEPTALSLFKSFGASDWRSRLAVYLLAREGIRSNLERQRRMVRIPVRLLNKKMVTLSPGGQNPLIRKIIEGFCERFAGDGLVIYIGDAERKFAHFEHKYLAKLGVRIDSAAKMPDVVVHDPSRNWLLLIEAVTSAGPVDGKRRQELKELFAGSTAGLIFVTAFESRRTMQSFLTQISWETEVWVADDPEHLIHFDGERFLGPYPD